MPWPTVGLLAGSAFASGLNLYATIATLGLLDRLGAADLPPELAILAHPAVLGVAGVLYIIEFFADKIPWVDSVWDAVHTFIRPPAAAVLAYAATAHIPEEWRMVAALLAGGVALTSHGVKATTRAAVNTSPEPFSNWGLSFVEDLVAIFLVWLAATHPLLTVAIVAVLVVAALFVIVKFFGFLRRAFWPRAKSTG
jgi:hypothetical protein